MIFLSSLSPSGAVDGWNGSPSSLVCTELLVLSYFFQFTIFADSFLDFSRLFFLLQSSILILSFFWASFCMENWTTLGGTSGSFSLFTKYKLTIFPCRFLNKISKFLEIYETSKYFIVKLFIVLNNTLLLFYFTTAMLLYSKSVKMLKTKIDFGFSSHIRVKCELQGCYLP